MRSTLIAIAAITAIACLPCTTSQVGAEPVLPDAPSPAPDEPSPAPDEPSPAPDEPSPAPDEPSPAPDEPTPTPAPPSTDVPPPTPPVPPATIPIPDEVVDRLDELDARAKQLERGQRTAEATAKTVDRLSFLSRFFTAIIDVGAFAAGGDGAGIRSDTLHANYPEYANTVSGQWVFMGDPLSTSINTLGEPADTADSRETPTDTIDSHGHPSLIVNSIGLGIAGWATDALAIRGLALMLPRPGADQIDVEYAYVELHPWPKQVYFYLGKIESVMGVEYRTQDAQTRTGITPSLICRYTCGRQLGARVDVVHHRLFASAAIYNGDTFEQRFEPDRSLHANKLPTGALHLQWKLRDRALGDRVDLALGASGALGPQDGQSDLSVRQWQYGLDARLATSAWDVVAELVQGHQPGASSDAMPVVPQPACDITACLRYRGAYLLVDRRLGEHGAITPYARFDWRDATHRSGADFVYEANSIRAAVGARLRVVEDRRVYLKAEYIWNHELGVPAFPHDVVTMSLVVSTE